MNITQADRIKSFTAPSVWLEFSPLANITNSINLGQGFPNWAPPDFLQDFAADSTKGVTYSTYARSAGHLNLAKNISKIYEKKLDSEIDPIKNVLVTVGATEALFLSIMSFINKGDEVILLEPAFDVYFGALEMAQANVKTVPLIMPTNDSHQIHIDFELLKQKLSKNTKAIIINTPHNPTGKVLTQQEINPLANLLKEYPQCLIISDEVYEYLVYDDHKHIPLATHKDLKDKTISIYSAGKTFSVTGWKIGWAIGPQELISRLQLTQQWVVFSVSTPHQEAIAKALLYAEKEFQQKENYYQWLLEEYAKKRETLYKGIKSTRLSPILPEGSFFIMANIKNETQEKKIYHSDYDEIIKKYDLAIDDSTKKLNDYNYCRYLSINVGITTIPNSAFYTKENKSLGENWIRFAFCKEMETLEQAIKLL